MNTAKTVVDLITIAEIWDETDESRMLGVTLTWLELDTAGRVKTRTKETIASPGGPACDFLELSNLPGRRVLICLLYTSDAADE